MRQMGLILSIMGILGMIVFLPAETNPDSETERVKRARKMASEARSLYHGKKIDAAADKYVEISEIYADLKQKYPEKKAYQKDYRHYLNQSGYVRLKYGQAMAREKKYKQAAEFYRKAVEAYQNALKKLPNTRIFKQNIEYCEYYGSQAAFTHALTNRDFAQ